MNTMKHIKYLFFSILILTFLTACTAKENSRYEGSLDTQNGDAIATVDGEDFHYNRDVLFYRDLAVYPEDAETKTPDWVGYYSDYGEIALGLELVYREAMTEGFALTDEKAVKTQYETAISGELLALADLNAQGNDEFARVYREYTEQITAIMERTKEEYGLKNDQALAEYTYPIYQKGYTASAYLAQQQDKLTGDVSTSRSFWQEYYQKLLQKYNVEILYKKQSNA